MSAFEITGESNVKISDKVPIRVYRSNLAPRSALEAALRAGDLHLAVVAVVHEVVPHNVGPTRAVGEKSMLPKLVPSIVTELIPVDATLERPLLTDVTTGESNVNAFVIVNVIPASVILTFLRFPWS
jgi:hypothetical protein